MVLKRLLAAGLIGALAIGAVGCKKETSDLEVAVEQTTPFERTINGHSYRFEGKKEDGHFFYFVFKIPSIQFLNP